MDTMDVSASDYEEMLAGLPANSQCRDYVAAAKRADAAAAAWLNYKNRK